MAVVQVVMEMSAEAAAGIASGAMKRYGGVIYHSTGGIVEHLQDAVVSSIPKEIPVPKSESAIATITKHLKNPKVIIVIGIGAAVATGLTYLAVQKNKKKKENAEIEIPECVADYNTALCTYLEAIRNGNLDLNTINCVIKSVDAMQESYYKNEIKIEFESEKSEVLVDFIYDYTMKLAEANAFEVNELEKPASVSGDNTFSCLRRYFETQKQIFEKAS